MMDFYRKIVEENKKELEKRIVKDVVVGIGYIGVFLDDGSLGLSYTLRDRSE